MWGTSETVTAVVQAVSAGTNPLAPTTQQLARVNYARPETWRFLFGATIQTGPDAPVGDPVIVVVDFDLIVGLGRSQMQLPPALFGTTPPQGFVRFVFDYTAIPAGRSKYTTVARAPEFNDTIATFRPSLELFPAQDIQCSARVTAVGGVGSPNLGQNVIVQCHAYFAPNVHTRPEWHADAEPSSQFRGNEAGGT